MRIKILVFILTAPKPCDYDYLITAQKETCRNFWSAYTNSEDCRYVKAVPKPLRGYNYLYEVLKTKLIVRM